MIEVCRLDVSMRQKTAHQNSLVVMPSGEIDELMVILWHRLECVVIFVIRTTVNWMSCLSSMDNGVRATLLIKVRPALKIHF